MYNITLIYGNYIIHNIIFHGIICIKIFNDILFRTTITTLKSPLY